MRPDHHSPRAATERVVRALRPGPTTGTRSAARRLAEVRGIVGGFRMPHEHLRLEAEDGVEVAATHLPGPAGGPAVVLAHGFGAHRRKPAYAYLADVLAQAVTVITVDLRGHGQSGGRSTLGGDEALDLAAGVQWLRDMGHDWVGGIGVSMGATTLANALHRGVQVEAAVAVSSPAHLHDEPRTEPMRRLHELWTRPTHRAALRLLTGVRVVEVDRFTRPQHPAEVLATVTVPTLVVHGEDDHFFAIEEWAAVARVHGIPLWREPAGFGHAEDGITPDFAEALVHAVLHVHGSGTFPPREAVREDS